MSASMTVQYEWCAEEVDQHGDALGLHFFDTRAEAIAHTAVSEGCAEVEVALVRDVLRDGDLDDRTWAYIGADGRLPKRFSNSGASWRARAAVPQRFRRGEG